MPVLRHLKRTPERCMCAMCRLHQHNRDIKRWMLTNPKKVTYLAEGELTSRHNSFNNAPAKKKSNKKNKK